MEILYSSTLVGFFLLLVIYFFYNHKSGGKANSPPGKTGYPVVGETLDFLYAGWKGHPEKFIFDRIARYSSHVFKTSLFGSQVIVFCGPNGHRFLFSNENKLVQVWAPSCFDKVFHRSKHTAMKEAFRFRQMFPNLLKPAALRGYLGLIDTIAHSHFVADWENKDTVVAYPLAYHYTFLLACRLFGSIEDPKHVAVLKKSYEVLAAGLVSVPIDFPGTALNRAIKASGSILKELVVVIKKRKMDLAEGKASRTGDILSCMILTSDENGEFMNEVDIAKNVLALIFAGHHTSTSASTSIVKYLAEQPQIYQLVYQEQMGIAKSKTQGELLNWNDIQKMRYSWNVACEAMRLAPPTQGFFREALEDFVYNGFSIQKGSKIYWNPYSTHANHEFFAEPQKFDPSRFQGSGPTPYTYLPFGGGPRICYGLEYAKLEMLVFMHHLVKRFRWEKMIPDEKVSFIPLPIPEKGLPIRLFPHETYKEHISKDFLGSEKDQTGRRRSAD